jgi:shikimate dehydrogenase
MRLFDLNERSTEQMTKLVKQISPKTTVEVGIPRCDDLDILMNASPVGMLSDARLPLAAKTFDKNLVVFDAIVMPEKTPLLLLAQNCGCVIVRGREMMLGQISRLVDYFLSP